MFFLSIPSPGLNRGGHAVLENLASKMSISLHDVEAKVVQRVIAQQIIFIFDVLGQVQQNLCFPYLGFSD